MAVSIEHLRPGDVVVVRVRDGRGCTEERTGRVVQVYRRHCLVLLRRGEAVVRESFGYGDILERNPEGVDAPALRPEDATYVAPDAARDHAEEEVGLVARGRWITSEEALEALRLHREEGLMLDQIAERFGVTRMRAESMVRKGRILERARVMARETDQVVQGAELSTRPAAAKAEDAAAGDDGADALAPFDPGAVQEEMDVGLAEAAARSGLTAELDARLDAAIERAARVLVQATSRIPDEMQQTLDRTRAQVATLEQEVALLRDELRALRAEFADHTHLPDGRPVIVRPIAAGVAWPVEGEEADTA